MIWRRHRRTGPRHTPEQVAATWQVASVLLDYPDDRLVERLPLLRTAATALPGELGSGLLDVIGWLTDTDLQDAQTRYVDTFDVTRRCALHLTYYSAGDTRRRGVELVRIKQTYQSAGVELGDVELPDHLCVVLEFGAAYDLDRAWRLLCDHRVGVELLNRALQQKDSPWHGALAAVRATLPELDGTDEEALARLIAQGPPTEEVGVELGGYAIDPRLNPRPEPLDLGPSIPVGAPK